MNPAPHIVAMNPTTPKNFGRFLLVLVAFSLSTAMHAAPIRIMPLGDSITAGYTDNPVWNVPFDFGYRGSLYSRLVDAGYSFQFVGGSAEPWNGQFGLPQTIGTPDLRAVNQDQHRGYGGWGVDQIAANIGSWLNTDNPDVVLLMAGINNIGQGSSGNPAGVESSLNGLVQTIVATKPNARVIVAQITPYAGYTDSIVQFNDYIKNTLVPFYAGQGKHVTTVDQYSNFLAPGGAIDAGLYSNGTNHPNETGYDRMAQTWLAGIQALGPITPTPAPMLVNGTFETPALGNNVHAVNPAGAAWRFTSGVTGAGSGVDRGNPYGAAYALNCTPFEGAQMAFLQGAGTGLGVTSIEQEITGLEAGQRYVISFVAKGMQGFDGANPFRVSAAGSELTFGASGLVNPSTDYTLYSSLPFLADGPTATLSFHDAGNVTFTKVSWIDDVRVAAVPAIENLVVNGGFERTMFGGNSHTINPSGLGWRFITGAAGAGSGVDQGNPYGVANSASLEGAQMAFLQGAGAGKISQIEQDVAGFEPGESYVLSFSAKAIAGFSGANPFRVSLAGTDLNFDGDSLLVPTTAGDEYISLPFSATSPVMTLRFYDAGNVPVGHVSWIDDVHITAVPEPSTLVLLGMGTIAVAALTLRRRFV